MAVHELPRLVLEWIWARSNFYNLHYCKYSKALKVSWYTSVFLGWRIYARATLFVFYSDIHRLWFSTSFGTNFVIFCQCHRTQCSFSTTPKLTLSTMYLQDIMYNYAVAKEGVLHTSTINTFVVQDQQIYFFTSRPNASASWQPSGSWNLIDITTRAGWSRGKAPWKPICIQ